MGSKYFRPLFFLKNSKLKKIISLGAVILLELVISYITAVKNPDINSLAILISNLLMGIIAYTMIIASIQASITNKRILSITLFVTGGLIVLLQILLFINPYN